MLFGKLFREPSENVTLPKKRKVFMTLMKRVQYTLMLAYKLRIERSRVRSPLVAPSCVLGQDRLTLPECRHERKNVDWKVKPSVVFYITCYPPVVLSIHFINLPFYLSVTSVTKVTTCKLICTNMHHMQFCFHVYKAIVAALADEVIDCPTNRGKPGRTVVNRGRTVTPPAHTVTRPAVTGTAP